PTGFQSYTVLALDHHAEPTAGVWNSGTTYAAGDIVGNPLGNDQGSFVSKVNSNLNHTLPAGPTFTEDAYWKLTPVSFVQVMAEADAIAQAAIDGFGPSPRAVNLRTVAEEVADGT